MNKTFSGVPNLPPHKFITNDELAHIFGQRLREIRKRRGLSRYKLAILTGFSEDTIRKYENGTRSPKLRFLLALFQELSVSMEEVFGTIEDNFEYRRGYLYNSERLWRLKVTSEESGKGEYILRTIERNPAYKPPSRQRPKPFRG